jgi:hypothetical protein
MGEASILTVDSGAMRSFGRYEMTAPLDGVFNVREAIRSCSPAPESDVGIRRCHRRDHDGGGRRLR